MADATKGEETKIEKKSGFVWWFLFFFKVIFFPITLPYYAVKFVVGGGLKYLWDEFFCFLFLDIEKDKDGQPKIAYFMTCSPIVHFHPLAWGGFVLAAIQMLQGDGEPKEWIGLTFLGLFIYSGLTVSLDFPFKRFVWFWFTVFVVIPLSDFGLKSGVKIIDQWLLSQNSVITLGFLEDGILIPLFKGIGAADAKVSSGFLILFSSLVSLVVIWSLIKSLLDDRYGFDGERLYRWPFGEGEESFAVYYQTSKYSIPDLHEAFFGFGSARFGIEDSKRGGMVLLNIPFMAFKSKEIERITAGKAIQPGEVIAGEAPNSASVAALAKKPHDHDDHGGE